MKRLLIISLGIVGVVFFTLQVTSCKKRVITPTHPTPDNHRLLSYTKFITPLIGTPVNQNFRFYYDDRGRVSQIAYTSNDEAEINASTAQRLMTFTYVNDTIFKTTTAVQTATVMERDTFIQNSQKQIVHVYMPGYEAHFEYFGKLLSRKTEYYFSDYVAPRVKVGIVSTYTSNNGDFLSHVFDGRATAEFSGLTPPLEVGWSYDLTVKPVKTVPGLTDEINDFTGYTLVVGAMDADGITVGPFQIPNSLFTREEHRVYPDLLNRAGDFYHLMSFTTYGVNIYQNEHLVRQISGTGPAVPGVLNIEYTIDADSKITQTYVTGAGYMTNSSVVFKMQYETF